MKCRNNSESVRRIIDRFVWQSGGDLYAFIAVVLPSMRNLVIIDKLQNVYVVGPRRKMSTTKTWRKSALERRQRHSKMETKLSKRRYDSTLRFSQCCSTTSIPPNNIEQWIWYFPGAIATCMELLSRRRCVLLCSSQKVSFLVHDEPQHLCSTCMEAFLPTCLTFELICLFIFYSAATNYLGKTS